MGHFNSKYCTVVSKMGENVHLEAVKNGLTL